MDTHHIRLSINLHHDGSLFTWGAPFNSTPTVLLLISLFLSFFFSLVSLVCLCERVHHSSNCIWIPSNTWTIKEAIFEFIAATVSCFYLANMDEAYNNRYDIDGSPVYCILHTGPGLGHTVNSIGLFFPNFGLFGMNNLFCLVKE